MLGPGSLQEDNYWRRCLVVTQYDADTVTLRIDLGFNVRIELPLRVWGTNAPELYTPEGKLALAWGKQWLLDHNHSNDSWPFRVLYKNWDKYAPRFDGVLICVQGHCYNDELLASGHAVVMRT